jgi:hypothetical protein
VYFDLLPGSRAMVEQVTGWINYYAGVAFFSFTIAAGRALLRRERWAVWGGAVCQALQAVSFAFLHGPHYLVAAGPAISLRVSSASLNFSAGFNSTFFLGTRVAGPAYEVTVNFLALAWTIVLLRTALGQSAAVEAVAA